MIAEHYLSPDTLCNLHLFQSVSHRRETLDKANSIIDRVKSVLDERFDDLVILMFLFFFSYCKIILLKRYNFIWSISWFLFIFALSSPFLHPFCQSTSDDEGVEDFESDHPFFKALNLSPRWPPEPNIRKRSKDRKTVLQKLLAIEDEDGSKDKRLTSEKTMRFAPTRSSRSSSAPLSHDPNVAFDQALQCQVGPSNGDELSEEGWTLMEMLDDTSSLKDGATGKTLHWSLYVGFGAVV